MESGLLVQRLPAQRATEDNMQVSCEESGANSPEAESTLVKRLPVPAAQLPMRARVKIYPAVAFNKNVNY